jgi:F-type H+-transporting ATPase subunit b
MSKVFNTALIFCLALIMFSAFSMAEEVSDSTGNEAIQTAGNDSGHATGHETDRSGDYQDLLYRFINFALLVIILFIVVKKIPVKSFLNARSEAIRQKLEDLELEKKAAESRYLDLEKQLKDFEGERKEIIDQFRKEGMEEKEKIINDAKVRVRQIIDQSELSIQQEIQAARNMLKQEIVDLAAQKAQEIIAKEMDDKDQDALVSDFIERVGKID